MEQSRYWEEKFRKYGFQYPLDNVTIKVYHYWKDDIERDLTNKLDSITDLLVDAGIIKNDSWQILKRIHSEGESYKNQIVQAITRIDVTQSYFD
jgi:Holliday junction resolvase RusA-like endonuclease